MTEAVTGQGVWLFTKDQESVRLSVRPAEGGFQLTIFGPGLATAEVSFAEMANLELFREKYAQDLLARGFQVAAVAERRQGIPGAAGPSSDRRR